MLGISRRVLVMLAFVAAASIVVDASAATLRRSCRDGLIAHRTDDSGGHTMSCDVDGRCDGVCSFELEAGTFTVPVGKTRRERITGEPGTTPTKLVLRCRPTPRNLQCTTFTTTTGGASTTTPAPSPGPTTTTRVRLVNPETTSSTTTTISTSSSTSSTIIRPLPIPCGTDFDCEGFTTSCAVSFCGFDGLCAQTCVCFDTDFRRTCSLDEALSCLTPDDCPGRLDDLVCRVCYLNLCVTDPAPACFFPALPDGRGGAVFSFN